MKYYYTLIILFLLLTACNTTKKTDTNEEANQSQVFDIEISKTPPLKNPTQVVDISKNSNIDSIIVMLPRDSYSTYTDHFNYIPDDEYYETNKEYESHLNDTIATGFISNDDSPALIDSLELDMDWLLIQFGNKDQKLEEKIKRGKTESYSYNDFIEYIPVTLLTIEEDDRDEIKYWSADIAFRGNYLPSDFKLIAKEPVNQMDLSYTVSQIQTTVEDPDYPLPRPMAADTLLLDNFFRFDANLSLAKYKTSKIEYGENDYADEVLFVVSNSTVKCFAAMRVYYHIFQLKDKKYLYIQIHTNTTSSKRLFNIEANGNLEEIYTHLHFTD